MSRRMDREGVSRSTIQAHINQQLAFTAQAHTNRLNANALAVDSSLGPAREPLFGFDVRSRFRYSNQSRFYHLRLILFPATWETRSQWLGSSPYALKISNLQERIEHKKAWMHNIKHMRACDKPRLP